MGFFARLPGFTYQYARYTDWICQYIHTISEIDKNDSKALQSDQKKILKVLNVLIERYEGFLKYGPYANEQESDERHEPDGEFDNVEMIDTAAAVQKNAPQVQYMILKAQSESESVGLNIEVEGLQLISNAIKCAYVDSKPNNQTNLAVDQAFLTRFGTNKPKNSSMSASANQPAGDQDQAVPDNLSTEAQGNINDAESIGVSNAGKFTEPDTVDDLKIDTDDPAIQHALGIMLQNQEYMWVFELPEEGKLSKIATFRSLSLTVVVFTEIMNR